MQAYFKHPTFVFDQAAHLGNKVKRTDRPHVMHNICQYLDETLLHDLRHIYVFTVSIPRAFGQRIFSIDFYYDFR